MIIRRILNNSVVSADDAGHEVIVLGKGLGFDRKVGDALDPSRIEKVFRLEDRAQQDRLRAVASGVPAEVLQVTGDIVQLASTALHRELSDSVYPALADHLAFALQRARDGVVLPNPLEAQVRTFYREEHGAAELAVDVANARLGVTLPEGEATNIALHLITASLDAGSPDVAAMMALSRDMAAIIRYHFGLDLDEQDARQARFLTHVRFFAQRVLSGEAHDGDDEALFELVRRERPEAFVAVDKVAAFLVEQHAYAMTTSERLYLGLHVERLI